jgi:hypothetical protein
MIKPMPSCIWNLHGWRWQEAMSYSRTGFGEVNASTAPSMIQAAPSDGQSSRPCCSLWALIGGSALGHHVNTVYVIAVMTSLNRGGRSALSAGC